MMHDDLDAGIPVLTEIVAPGSVFPAVPAIQETSLAQPESPLAPIAPNAEDITQDVLQQLQGHIQTLLETHIRLCIDEAMLAVSSNLAKDISASVQQTATRLVKETVAQELAKHDFHKTKNP